MKTGTIYIWGKSIKVTENVTSAFFVLNFVCFWTCFILAVLKIFPWYAPLIELSIFAFLLIKGTNNYVPNRKYKRRFDANDPFGEENWE